MKKILALLLLLSPPLIGSTQVILNSEQDTIIYYSDSSILDRFNNVIGFYTQNGEIYNAHYNKIGAIRDSLYLNAQGDTIAYLQSYSNYLFSYDGELKNYFLEEVLYKPGAIPVCIIRGGFTALSIGLMVFFFQ